MSQRTDWLPTTRDAILAMADNWIGVCTAQKTDWNIPNPGITDLTSLKGLAAEK